MQLKEYIRQYRADRGNMSQRAFAQKCGLSNGYISMIEKGINPSTGEEPVLTPASITKLATGLDMSVHALINAVDDIKIDIGFFSPPDPVEQSDILYISRPSGDLKADEIRKYLHETIDSLSDSNLEFFKDFTLRIKK